MFKKISQVAMGVFNFKQNGSAQSTIAEFKKNNIIYGNNYSGKTTLSKIFRAIEKGSLPPNYKNPLFLIDDNNRSISQNSIPKNCTVRVFNEDFVKENLSFVIDENGDISSFILGEGNKKTDDEIKKLQSELGSIEDGTGLYQDLRKAKQTFDLSSKQASKTEEDLDTELQHKAKEIKNNTKTFGEVLYNIGNIKADIKIVCKADYQPIDETQKGEYTKLLKDEIQSDIPPIPAINLQFDTLAKKAEVLITKKITITKPIQELLSNQFLEDWVRSGRSLNKDRKKCGFCRQTLTIDIKNEINQHFNKESDELIGAIDRILGEIKQEKKNAEGLLSNINAQEFYSKFRGKANDILSKSPDESRYYSCALDNLEQQIEARRKSTSQPLEFQLPESNSKGIKDLHESMKELIIDNNKYSSRLHDQQKDAQRTLLLHEVKTYVGNISYDNRCQHIETLKQNAESDQKAHAGILQQIELKNEKISDLQNLGGEQQGTEEINDLLNNYFGHRFLSLRAIQDGSPHSYKFEIVRKNEKAYNLSQGEKNLIAFCYFIAKLDDVKTKDSNPIIWIDDPVSSLDSNHIFFVFSVIAENIISREKYEQLFISTHNLDFLKYFKSHFQRENSFKFFLIDRQGEFSQIIAMPKQQHMSEFSYLFHQIHQCAHADLSNYNIFYNFPNSARRFMEMFLFYLDPNNKTLKNKMLPFFDNDSISRTVINRILHEYSHGNIKSASFSIEALAPQMKKEAEFILKKIEEKNPGQYKALLESIEWYR